MYCKVHSDVQFLHGTRILRRLRAARTMNITQTSTGAGVWIDFWVQILAGGGTVGLDRTWIWGGRVPGCVVDWAGVG